MPFALVAVVSGRPTAFLADVLGAPPGVALVGLYGLERALQGPAHDTWAAVIDEVVAEALATAPEGVYVEPKGLTVTLHFRRAPEHKDWVVAFAERQHATTGSPGASGSARARASAGDRRGQGHCRARAGGRARRTARRRAASGAGRFWRRRGRPARLRRPGGAPRRRRPAAPRGAGGRRRHREPGRGGRGGGPVRAGRARARRRSCATWPTPPLSAERPPAGRPTSRPRYARAPRCATLPPARPAPALPW